jgi:hypothetical protein
VEQALYLLLCLLSAATFRCTAPALTTSHRFRSSLDALRAIAEANRCTWPGGRSHVISIPSVFIVNEHVDIVAVRAEAHIAVLLPCGVEPLPLDTLMTGGGGGEIGVWKSV